MSSRRRVRGALATLLAAATAVAVLGAAPAEAADNNAPNMTVSGYGVTAGGGVFCDKASRTMTVAAKATTMQTSGLYGPTASPYDAGQWISYRILARERGVATWSVIYNWAPWQWIVSYVGLSGGSWLSVPQLLGTNVVTGWTGHTYEIRVDMDWWTGRENMATVPVSFSQLYRADAYNTYYFAPSACVF